MKQPLKLIIQVFILITANILQAQTYKSVLENTTFVQYTNTMIWVDKKSTSDDDDPFYMGTQYSLDSICFQDYREYEGFIYSRYESLRNYNYPQEFIELLGYEVFLRESDDYSKLYSRYDLSNFNSEFLIYDISLQQGDTFPTTIHLYYDGGVGYTINDIDTNLIVDTVYWQEGRKIVQFNYYQKFGPYSQYYKFIEGIGSNFGIFPIMSDGYNNPWACLLGTYKREEKQYDFYKGVLPEPYVLPYYSSINYTGWGHYIAKNYFPINEEGNDPYYSSMAQGYDSLVFESIKDLGEYRRLKLYSVFSGDTVYITQTGNRSKLYSNLNDTSLITAKLIYDISLEKGDTFITNCYIKSTDGLWEWKDTSLVVDTVFISEGRKVVEFDYWQQFGPFSYKYKFIEGIGPSNGLFPLSEESGYTFGKLTSVYNDWMRIYGYSPFVSVQELTNQKVKVNIYPNPSSGLLYIEGIDNPSSTLITIYNLQGKKVCTKKMDFSMLINIKDIPRGLYFLSVTNNNQIIQTIKLLKQ